MLDTAELKTLAHWCRGRGLRFHPLGVSGEGAQILLERQQATQPWQRMKLLLDEDGFCLRDELNEILATASDLPALLDALDGGVAEPASPPYATRGRISQGFGLL